MSKKVTIGRRPTTPDAVAAPQARPDPEAVDRWLQGQAAEPGVPPVQPKPVLGEPAEKSVRAAKKAKAPTEETPQEPMKRLTIDIPLSLHRRVKSQCGEEGLQMADVIRGFLEKRFPKS
jgi:hypothetical protein